MGPQLVQYLHGALNYRDHCSSIGITYLKTVITIVKPTMKILNELDYRDHCSSIGITFTHSAQPQIHHGFLRTPYQGSKSYELQSYCVEAGHRYPFGILLASNC